MSITFKRPWMLGLFFLSLSLGCVYSKSGPPTAEEEAKKQEELAKTQGGGAGVVTATTSLKAIGIKLDNDFSMNGKFLAEMLVEDTTLESLEDYLSKVKGSLESMTCEITAPTGLTCSCPDSSVTPAKSGALDIAIDVDSSGSNVPQPDDPTYNIPPSDPQGKRLAAAQAVVDVLLTGQNRIASFDFGTSYCDYPESTTCPQDDPDSLFYRNLTKVGWVTNRFADYTDASGKENLKSAIAKEVWQKNRGTPIYDSLLEIMNDMPIASPRSSIKMILVFSDGLPQNNIHSGEEVCAKSEAMSVPIVTVGYGQASLHDPLMDPNAVRVMQNIATCSHGSYLAIEDIDQITQKVGEMGKGIIKGHLDANCSIPTEAIAGLDPTKTVDGKIRLKFKGLADLKDLLFNFLPPQ